MVELLFFFFVHTCRRRYDDVLKQFPFRRSCAENWTPSCSCRASGLWCGGVSGGVLENLQEQSLPVSFVRALSLQAVCEVVSLAPPTPIFFLLSSFALV